MVLEPRIRVLADVMERIPGVSVLSGCGGHEDPPDQSHIREGEFIVNFIVERDRIGFRALHLITFGCSEVDYKGKGKAHVITKYAKTAITDGKILCFDLVGTANPDDIAESIQAMLMILRNVSAASSETKKQASCDRRFCRHQRSTLKERSGMSVDAV